MLNRGQKFSPFCPTFLPITKDFCNFCNSSYNILLLALSHFYKMNIALFKYFGMAVGLSAMDIDYPSFL